MSAKYIDDELAHSLVNITTIRRNSAMQSELQLFSEYPEIVTHANLCTMLNLSRNYGYQLLQSGKIMHIRMGSKYLIPKENIIRYVEDNLQ